MLTSTEMVFCFESADCEDVGVAAVVMLVEGRMEEGGVVSKTVMDRATCTPLAH